MAKTAFVLSAEEEQKIASAILNGDAAAMRDLLERGFPIDTPLKSRDEQTLLGIASNSSRSGDIAIELLKAGANYRKGQINLIWAVYRRDEWAVRFLIEQGADVNISGRGGKPLELAASLNLPDIVLQLLDAGADVNVGALGAAVKKNHGEIALMLLEAGATLPAGEDLLAQAIQHHNVEVSLALIKAGADLNFRTQIIGEHRGAEYVRVFSHVTPLIIASALGETAVVQALIEGNADIYLTDATGETALDWAKKNAHADVAAVLETVARTKPRKADPDRDLLMAAQAGAVARIEAALKAGAEIEARDDRPLLGGLTPLMHSARGGHKEAVEVLLEAGADIALRDDIEKKDGAGFSFIVNEAGVSHAVEAGYQLHRTALHWAAASGGGTDAGKLLIDRGSDIRALDRAGMSAMMLAAEQGTTLFVKDLLAAGADPNERGQKKKSSIHFAARNGHVGVVCALLAAGAKVDQRDSEQKTALMLAADRAQSEVVQVLLDAGADVHLRDKGEYSSIQHACGSGVYKERYKKGIGFCLDFVRPPAEILKTVQLLVNAGADPTLKLKHGFSAAELAKRALERDVFYQQILDVLATANPTLPTKQAKEKPASKPAEKKAKKKVSDEPAPRPHFVKAAKAEGFQKALAELEEKTGSKRQPLEQNEGAFAFHVHSSKAKSFDLEKMQPAMLELGCFVFSLGHESTDRIAALPTTDKYDALLAMQTNGANEDLMPQDVVAGLKGMEKDQPFILLCAGFDFVGGKFTSAVKKPRQLTKKMVAFCSDMLESLDEDAAAEQIRETRQFFFWWD